MSDPLRCVAFAIFLIFAATPAATGEPSISAPNALQKARAGDLRIIDVRSPREWRQTGSPAGAASITMHEAEGLGIFLRKVLSAVSGDRDAPVALICERYSVPVFWLSQSA